MQALINAHVHIGYEGYTTWRSDNYTAEYVLDHLSAGPARMVMVTLEDLWQEARPQNVPGTVDEYPNWRRVARHRLERIRTLPSVVRTLRRIDAIRRGSTSA